MVKRSQAAENTPMMEQWFGVKRDHPDSLLFFRMGDFFELFHDDAKIAANVLGITLTARSKGDDAIPMAGVPAKSAENYLRKLIKAGQRVVICDQVEDPKQAKGLVERAVTRIVTAGTLTEEELLEQASANYLLALFADKKHWGFAYADLSTGRFHVSKVPHDLVLDEISRLSPAEIVLPEDFRENDLSGDLERVSSATLTYQPNWTFDPRNARETLQKHYSVKSVSGFGLEEEAPYVPAAGAILQYLNETQKAAAHHLDAPKSTDLGSSMFLDGPTRRCLELVKSAREGRIQGTLAWCLDRTVTAMGARKLKEKILSPLRDLSLIQERLRALRELYEDKPLLASLRTALEEVRDLERITAKVAMQRANARDLVSLRESLRKVPDVREAMSVAEAALLQMIYEDLDPLDELREWLDRSIIDEPPMTIKEGGMIRDGYHEELDRLNRLRRDGHSCLAELQQREIEKTGIKTLRVGYNKVFGFYIEVSRAQGGSIPDHYIRKQTLKNAERFITPELKEHESQVLSADERAKDLESELFEEIRVKVASHAASLKQLAAALAELDSIQSLSVAAREHGFIEPEVHETGGIDIKEGRHPALAALIGRETFVPNSCDIGGDSPHTIILTGPNMAGKSTYLRQTALIVLMAQMGSFVPAEAAKVPIVDRIFTRVGASDDLVEGASTFMVEMTETATILHNATEASLVLLDEVGRGTSTYDGVALAWAISEHLHRRVGAMTLFATHYHQLMALATENAKVKNMNVSVKEWGQEIIFLHRIVEGGTDRSYGIHVARLAGIPPAVIERAREILTQFEEKSVIPETSARESLGARQLLLFEPPEEKICDEMTKLNLNEITPLEAMQKIQEWQKALQEPGS